MFVVNYAFTVVFITRVLQTFTASFFFVFIVYDVRPSPTDRQYNVGRVTGGKERTRTFYFAPRFSSGGVHVTKFRLPPGGPTVIVDLASRQCRNSFRHFSLRPNSFCPVFDFRIHDRVTRDVFFARTIPHGNLPSPAHHHRRHDYRRTI